MISAQDHDSTESGITESSSILAPAKGLQEEHVVTEHGGSVMNESKTKKKSPSLLLLLGLLTLLVIVFVKAQRVPVLPEEGVSAPAVGAEADYNGLIRMHAEQAGRRNQNALVLFQMELDRILRAHDVALTQAGRDASEAAAGYGSCCKLVYYLACDKAKGGNKAESYLNSQINPVLALATRALGVDIDAAVGTLEYDLRRSTVQLATDLAALGPGNFTADVKLGALAMNRADFQNSLRTLGLNAIGVGASLPFDAVALCGSRLFAGLPGRLVGIAGRLFSKQIAAGTASVVAPAVDGPLPIGDILAVGGAIWTGYDIYSSRRDFEQEITTSLEGVLRDMGRTVRDDASAHANRLLRQHEEFQNSIGVHAQGQFAQGGK